MLYCTELSAAPALCGDRESHETPEKSLRACTETSLSTGLSGKRAKGRGKQKLGVSFAPFARMAKITCLLVCPIKGLSRQWHSLGEDMPN